MAAGANVNYFTIDPRGLVGMTTEFMEMAGRWLARDGRPAGHGQGQARMRPTRGCGGFNAQTELMKELMVWQNSLRELAEKTGGIASVNTNS